MSEPMKEFNDGWDLVYIKDEIIYPVYLSDDQQFVFDNIIKPLIHGFEKNLSYGKLYLGGKESK
jgi:hypothetical protein